MAYGYSSNPGPPAGDEEMDSLYGDGDEGKGKGEGEESESIDDQEREEMTQSAMVPIRVLQKDPNDRVKVGDERVLRVKAIHGEDAECVYATGEEKEAGEEGEEGKPAEGGEMGYDKELEMMDKEG